MVPKSQITNVKVAHHRNGISGTPFHVVTFEWADPEAPAPRKMVAVLFETDTECAVLDRDMLQIANIEFAGGNSWRGDHFEPTLRALISEQYAAVRARYERNGRGE